MGNEDMKLRMEQSRRLPKFIGRAMVELMLCNGSETWVMNPVINKLIV